MIYTKELLLKGLLGLGVAGGATYGGWTQRDKIAEFFSTKDEPAKPAAAVTAEAITDLPGKVGLECNGWNTTATADNGVDCSKKTGDGAKNIKVKKDESTNFEVSTIPANSKIKLYKLTGAGDNDYNKGLKFVIEDGDIAGSGSDSDKKLEQFETYEVKQEDNGGEWKLTRKKKSWEEKRRILGLDSCTFPEGTSQTQTTCDITSENINKVGFEGKTGTVTGTGNLQISIASSTDSDFPLGFKFTLTPSSDITVQRSSGNALTLKNGKAKEFKIKQNSENKKLLTLEEAWTLTNLADKVNLTCTPGSSTPSETVGVDCTKKADSSDGIKAKKDSTEVNVSAISGGKIKVYKASTGETHNEGFKFVIEENDISGDNSQKLEQFETYEIKKESGEWKLNRKSEAKVGIKKALGLPEVTECDLPTDSNEKECDISGEKFKKIKFSAGDSERGTASENTKLKISKPSGSENSDYGPFGYKFVLDSASEVKISNSLTAKGSTKTEFKIKRTTGSNEISLEKALDVVTLGKKINLICSTNGSGTKDCSLDTGKKINVKDGNSSRKDATFKSGYESKKLTYEEGHDGYNQGIKFSASDEICLENGTPESGTPTSIANGNTGYEIKKDGDDWFLVKKSNG